MAVPKLATFLYSVEVTSGRETECMTKLIVLHCKAILNLRLESLLKYLVEQSGKK